MNKKSELKFDKPEKAEPSLDEQKRLNRIMWDALTAIAAADGIKAATLSAHTYVQIAKKALSDVRG
jgi:hypothetical protein